MAPAAPLIEAAGESSAGSLVVVHCHFGDIGDCLTGKHVTVSDFIVHESVVYPHCRAPLNKLRHTRAAVPLLARVRRREACPPRTIEHSLAGQSGHRRLGVEKNNGYFAARVLRRRCRRYRRGAVSRMSVLCHFWDVLHRI